MKKLKYIIPLVIVSILSIFPFYFILMMSTHTTSEIFRGQVFLPGKALVKNFATIIKGGFFRYYWNSLYTSTISAILCVFVSALAGFALTKYDFKFKKQITKFILVTMMIPSQVSLIGYVIEMKHLRLSNTHAPLILIWGASAYGVFFMMQYMDKGVPTEIVESARIDGSSEFGIFYRMVLPLIKPAIGTLSTLIFLWSWNNYLLQVTLINKKSLFTIPLGIQSLANAYTQDWGARGAALAISVLPFLIIFAIGSKYFIKGLAAGAVKG